LPDCVDPELSRRAPDIPAEDAFPVAITIEPDPLLMLVPLDNKMEPPRLAPEACPPLTVTCPPTVPVVVVMPAESTKAPPTPVSVLPTTTLMAPP